MCNSKHSVFQCKIGDVSWCIRTGGSDLKLSGRCVQQNPIDLWIHFKKAEVSCSFHVLYIILRLCRLRCQAARGHLQQKIVSPMSNRENLFSQPGKAWDCTNRRVTLLPNGFTVTGGAVETLLPRKGFLSGKLQSVFLHTCKNEYSLTYEHIQYI